MQDAKIKKYIYKKNWILCCGAASIEGSYPLQTDGVPSFKWQLFHSPASPQRSMMSFVPHLAPMDICDAH